MSCWILGRPGLRLGPVLAVEDEVAVEPWRLGVHRPVGGLRLAVTNADAEAGCRRLAGVAVLEGARRLDLVEVLGESVDLRIQLGRTPLRRFRLVDILKEDVPGHFFSPCL